MAFMRMIVAAITGAVVGFGAKYYALLLCASDAHITKPLSRCIICGNSQSFVSCLKQIILHRTCDLCGKKLSFIYHSVETVMMLIYAIGAVLIVDIGKLAFFCVLTTVLVAASIVDIRIMKVPYICSLCVLLPGASQLIISVIQQNDWWKSQLLGLGFVLLTMGSLALAGKLGGGDFHLIAASSLALGLKGVIIALIAALMLGLVVSIIVVINAKHNEEAEIKCLIPEILQKWYIKQKVDNKTMLKGKTDTIYFNIINGRVCIDDYSYNHKKWRSKPDVKELRSMLDNGMTGISSKYGTAINITDSDAEILEIKKITCKKLIPFVPLLSVGVAIAYLLVL